MEVEGLGAQKYILVLARQGGGKGEVQGLVAVPLMPRVSIFSTVSPLPNPVGGWRSSV